MSDPSIPGQAAPEKRAPFVAASERRAPPTEPPLPPDQRVGFALVGLGRLSLDSILPAIGETRLCRLAAVMTDDLEKGRRVAAQYGAPADAVYTYEEWDKLGANADVRAVYVVTPNGSHREHVTRAAEVGKAVLCEKPMANTVADAEAMVDACD